MLFLIAWIVGIWCAFPFVMAVLGYASENKWLRDLFWMAVAMLVVLVIVSVRANAA